MVASFGDDLKLAHSAEDTVREELSKLTKDYTFYDVSGNREYYHKGDIKAVAADGKEFFLEVKCDSRIAETHNLLCEEEVLYFDSGELKKGNFYSDYEIYCVLSKEERKIYIMDFSKLKAHYKSGKYKTIKHWD